jgi:hypothetical protein
MSSKLFEQKPWFRSLKSKSQPDIARAKRIGPAVDAAQDEETVRNTSSNRNVPAGDAEQQSSVNRNNNGSFKGGQNFNRHGRNYNRQDHYLESKSTNDFFTKPNQQVAYRNNNNNSRFNHAAAGTSKNFQNGYQNRQNRNQQARVKSVYLDEAAPNPVANSTTFIVSEQTGDDYIDQNGGEIPVVAYLVEDLDENGDVVRGDEYDDGEEHHVVLDDAEFVVASSDLSDDWDSLNENQRKNDDLIDSLKRQIEFLNKQLSEADKDDSSFINDLKEKIENIAQMSHVSDFFFISICWRVL